MRLSAYILAADAAWVDASVRSYYDIVDSIIVSYDATGRGWTGAPIPVEETLARLRSCDPHSKMRFVPGNFALSHRDLMEADTAQRRAALGHASPGADWVLQLDTDEILPSPGDLVSALSTAERHDCVAVEWPMRVLFRSLPDGRVLEVCERDGRDRFEYPGPIAVRPTANLVHARQTDGRFLRAVVEGDDRSLQLQAPPLTSEVRDVSLSGKAAVLHYSWVGDRRRIRSKIASWSHNAGLRSWVFYYRHWLPAPLLWRWMHDFHPFAGDLWPALKVSSHGQL